MKPEQREERMGEATRFMWDRLTYEWQPLEPLMQAAIRQVPPGVAYRKYQGIDASYRRRKGANVENPNAPRTRQQMIDSGAKAIVNAAVRTLAKPDSVYAERRDVPGDDGKTVTMIRRQPICPTCGHDKSLDGPETEASPKVKLPRDNVIPFPRERIAS